MSLGREEAYEVFKRDFDKDNKMEEAKAELRERCAEAKRIGQKMIENRNASSETDSVLQCCTAGSITNISFNLHIVIILTIQSVLPAIGFLGSNRQFQNHAQSKRFPLSRGLTESNFKDVMKMI